MKTRSLGKTGLQVPILSFGASSLGQEFRSVTLDEALGSVKAALDCGLNLIDTSPFYGRGMSEVLLGVALKSIPRDDYLLCTKLGHDIEFVPMQQIVDETLPALRKAREQGKIRFIGFSGYPQKIFRFICDQAEVDCVLNYNQYTLQNTRFADETIAYLEAKGIGVMNAGPFSARLLTDAPLPHWLKEPEEVKGAARRAADLCRARGSSIAKLALQFSIANPGIATTVAGSANPANVREWARWAAEPLDEELVRDVQAIFAPVKNIGHVEGLPENN